MGSGKTKIKRRRTKLPRHERLKVLNRHLSKEMDNQLNGLSSVVGMRRNLSHGLGMSYEGQRDIYMALGYKKDLIYQDYYNKYERADISKRIVTAYPDATWRGEPEIVEDENTDETAFEKEINELFDLMNIYHYLTRLDILTGLGRYAILYLGFNDLESIEDAKDPVVASTNMELIYLQPYSEENAKINTYVTDPTDSRYGMPETYKLTVQNLNTATGIQTDKGIGTSDIIVHWTRVVHSAEDLLESNVFGTPRLKAVYNRLENVELIAGGSAESMWRGGFPGMSFELDSEAEMDAPAEAALDKQIDEYIHSLRRYLKLQGMEAKTHNPEIYSPKDHIEIQLQLISGATGIPVRILTGSERGELASSQDKENWMDRVAERRGDFAEPVILRPFIETLVAAGVVKAPAGGYQVKWQDLDTLSDKDQSEIAERRSKALGEYAKSGADAIVPPVKFFVEFLGMDEDIAKSIVDDMIEAFNDERRDMMEAKETDGVVIDVTPEEE